MFEKAEVPSKFKELLVQWCSVTSPEGWNLQQWCCLFVCSHIHYF